MNAKIQEEKAATREQCVEHIKKNAAAIVKICNDDQEPTFMGRDRIECAGDLTYYIDQIQRWTVALERKIG